VIGGLLSLLLLKETLFALDLGWRLAFGMGAILGLGILFVRRNLPESPRWREIRGDAETAERETAALEAAAMRAHHLPELPPPDDAPVAPGTRATLREVFAPEYRTRTVMLYIFQALQTVGYYGFGTLAPLVLAEKGFDIVETLGYSAVIFLGFPIGSAASIPIVERFERKTLIMGSALAMAVLGVIFGFARTPALILTAGFLLTAASNVFSNAFHTYQAEIFPTRMRATAVGTAYSLSRLTGAVLPFISVAVLDGLGATAVFLGSAAIMTILALDIWLLGPRSTGRNLEAVEARAPARHMVQA